MSYIIFENPGTFDLRLIKTFGVNVKPNSKSAIGYFGTGLKYAAAIVLRNGGEFIIQDGEGSEYHLEARIDSVRGKEFLFVYMGDHQLPFTTELGKNWMPWHAYRELYSNAIDEHGHRYESEDIPEPKKDVVRFIIKSEPMLEVFFKHGNYFLDTHNMRMLGSNEHVSVYWGSTKGFYLKSIRVYDEQLPFAYTYNAIQGISLSEDRIAHYEYERKWLIRAFWCECQNKKLLREFALTPHNFYIEGKIDFTTEVLSNEFYEVLEELLENNYDKIMPTLRKNALNRRADNAKFHPIELTSVQGKMLNRSIEFLKTNGYPVDDYPIIATNLGESVMGLADDQKIYVSRIAFDKGMKQVVATLLEEFIHLHHNVPDCSRQMQDVLFDKIVNMMEEKQGEPI
jgi:hypothetical protein